MKIQADFVQEKDKYELVSGFGMAMSVLAKSRQELFKPILSYYLEQGDKLGLNPTLFVQMFMESYKKEETFAFLNHLNFSNKERWLFAFYQVLPEDQIGENDAFALHELFQNANQTQIPSYLDFILNYSKVDKHLLVKVAKTILDKYEMRYSAWTLASITNPHSEIHKQLELLFGDDIDTLKKVYLAVKSAKEHDDYNSATLSKIFDLDLGFINEYIEWIYLPKGENSRWHHDDQDYSLLWRNKNYREIFTRIIEFIYQKERPFHYYSDLRNFFIHNERQKLDADIEQKQIELLTELINKRYNDIDFIQYLFEVAVYYSKEQRSRLIFTFLQKNKKLSDFEKLSIEPGLMSWSGSAVPVYQSRIDYLKSLLPMMNSSELLEHRVYLQETIDRLESEKNAEKKRDFMGSDL